MLSRSHRQGGGTRSLLAALALVGMPLTALGQGVHSNVPRVDQFVRAAEMGDLDQVKRLLPAQPNVDVRDEGGWTALMQACFRGHRPVAQYLLDHGANVNAHDPAGDTPLTCTIVRTRGMGLYHGNLVRLLIRRGADVNARDARGNTPLMLMVGCDLCVSCAPEVPMPATSLAQTVRLLLDAGADVAARNRAGKTALALASRVHTVTGMVAAADDTQRRALARRAFDPAVALLKRAEAQVRQQRAARVTAARRTGGGARRPLAALGRRQARARQGKR